MGFPTDPQRRAETIQKMRAAAQRRWTPEARAQASHRSKRQFEDPEVRRKMSLSKKRYFSEHPEARRHIAQMIHEQLPMLREKCRIAYQKRKALKERKKLIQAAAQRLREKKCES